MGLMVSEIGVGIIAQTWKKVTTQWSIMAGRKAPGLISEGKSLSNVIGYATTPG